MTEEPTRTESGVRVVTFANGNRARLFLARDGAQASEVLASLGLSLGRPIVLLIGGADSLDPAVERRLAQLFSRGVARAAASADAMVVDGGTESGAMALMGRGAAFEGQRRRLIGVAPAGKVTYPGGPLGEADRAPLDPNHAYFVLSPSDEWGGETSVMFRLTDALAQGRPVVAVLAGGGPVARGELWGVVRRGWPIIVLAGTGGLSDQLIQAVTPTRSRGREAPDGTSEIVAEADLRQFPIEGSPEDLQRMLSWNLRDDVTLKTAWEQFALFNANAKRHRRTFLRLQLWILALGVLATALVVTQTTLLNLGLIEENSLGADAIHYVILVFPIAITILVGASARFRVGSNWVLLRKGAELIKSEIYRYRTGTGGYRSQAGPTRAGRESAASILASRVGLIIETVMKSDVSESSLRPPDDPLPPRLEGAAASDDGLRALAPEDYVAFRIDDQAAFYRGRAVLFARRLRLLQWGILIAGGLGAVLAALGLELWIALTTALTAAFASYLGFMQLQNILVHYNQAAANLVALKAWWEALDPDALEDSKHRDALVDRAERIMRTEQAGWEQEMTDALEDLRRHQERGAGEGTRDT